MKGFVNEDSISKYRLYYPIHRSLALKTFPEKEDAKAIINKYGVDTQRPLISQVSRFDPGRTRWGN